MVYERYLAFTWNEQSNGLRAFAWIGQMERKKSGKSRTSLKNLAQQLI